MRKLGQRDSSLMYKELLENNKQNINSKKKGSEDMDIFTEQKSNPNKHQMFLNTNSQIDAN